MKRQEEQIAARLHAFDDESVKKGFRIWARERMQKFRDQKADFLRKAGWYPVREKPKNKEFFYLGGQYWIQDIDYHFSISRELKRKDQRTRSILRRGKSGDEPQKAMVGGIEKTDVKCPYCNHLMYKERVCSSCKEGRQGYRIRLMCEDNPDHEVLL